MAKYQAVKRIEDRDQSGKKIVIKSGTTLDLTKEQAKRYGSAVVPAKATFVKADAVSTEGDGDSGAAAE